MFFCNFRVKLKTLYFQFHLFRMTVGDCITIIFTAVFTALISETITYLLVYRTEKYQRLNAVIEKGSKV